MEYAGFRYRLIANVVDFLVFLPSMGLFFWLHALSRTAAIITIVPMSALYFSYSVYFHKRWGQTLGKMAAGIRVVKESGDLIGWREALLRSSVDILFSILTMVAYFIGLLAVPPSVYDRMSWMDQVKALSLHEPNWAIWVDRAQNVWIWSEVVVILFNPRKRALHDFIAGTVVIVVR